jgi:hypothetical protein
LSHWLLDDANGRPVCQDVLVAMIAGYVGLRTEAAMRSLEDDPCDGSHAFPNAQPQLEKPMNTTTKRLAASLLTSLAMIASSGPVWSANTAAETEQVKQQMIAIPGLQQEVAKATGNDAKNIDITSSPHQVTITVVNSKLNEGVDANRRAEASTMVSTFARAVAEKAPFAQVMVIHVDYVKRTGNSDKAIQRYDFNKSPAGIFVAHSS